MLLNFRILVKPDIELSAQTVNGVLSDVIALLRSACYDAKTVKMRDGVLVARRVLDCPRETLRELGDRYGVSHEWIRRSVNRAWKTLSQGIYCGNDEIYGTYRKGIERILLNVPDEAFVATVARISRLNIEVGQFLQMLIVGNDAEN